MGDSHVDQLPATQSGDASVLQWLAIAWAKDAAELQYLIRRVLVDAMGFLENGEIDGWLQITPQGWQFLGDFDKRSELKDTAFVAMPFAADMLPIWQNGIYVGVRNAGYKAVRVDKHEHNNRIDDEILSLIRRCRFVVADFTGQNQGVYFEAGFGLGLGKPVIWTCERPEISDKKVHFDTRQYSFVRWTHNGLDQFQRDLQNRIEATIGRGPSRVAA